MDASTTVRATKRWWFELLACLALQAAATAVLGVSAAPPTAADLAHCPKSCGGVNISYPYGIGPGCFRPGFEVTCNHSTRPPKLFLANTTTTEIVKQYPEGAVDASIVFNIATSPGASGNYSWSWEAPGKSLIIYQRSAVFIVGCGFEAFLFENTTSGPGDLLGNCASTCADSAALGTEAEEGDCNGMGCCNIALHEQVAFTLSIIQKEETVPAALANATVKAFLSEGSYSFRMADLLSDKINQSTIGAATAYLIPVITDQPTCRTARMNKQYACAANSDYCADYHDGNGGYYVCGCSSEYDDGNPYVVGPDGCYYPGKYCSSNGDVALRNRFMNLHVHICVFLFIFNLTPQQSTSYPLQLLSTAAYKQAIIIFLKHRTNAHTLISYTCTLTHVSPRTNTPLVNHHRQIYTRIPITEILLAPS